MTPSLGYYLGLPAWAYPGWAGSYFPDTGNTLANYASVFNTVEGNTTFYRIPEVADVSRWARAVGGTQFRFSFKLPRQVTHQHRPDRAALRQFFDVLMPLGDHLGPFLVQCPATLGPRELPALEALFGQLPMSCRYALEVRHLAFFEQPERLEPLLEQTGAGRVMFDSRPIYHEDTQHPEVLAARHKKPDVPLLDTVYNDLVYARVVLHPDPDLNTLYSQQWTDRCTNYLVNGYELYFMMHCPNNQHCPQFAADFHRELSTQQTGVQPLPPWPLPQQNSLF
ncbi:MAG: DUF72 domain-containing protein [Pseudomonadota bacterium]